MLALVNLLIISFLAGSFIPLGSEAYLLYLQSVGHSLSWILVIATLGNTLGGMTCYLLAKYKGRAVTLKFLRFDQERLDLWEKRLSGRGEWLSFFCWLPFVGEFIAAVCGLLQLRASYIFLYMFFGKLFRYGLLLNIVDSFL